MHAIIQVQLKARNAGLLGKESEVERWMGKGAFDEGEIFETEAEAEWLVVSEYKMSSRLEDAETLQAMLGSHALEGLRTTRNIAGCVSFLPPISPSISDFPTLLETVCKHTLDDLKRPYNEKDELPRVYKETAEALNFSPGRHPDMPNWQ